MPYRIAGIDVHKRMLAVVVADVESMATFISNARRPGPRRAICAASPPGWSRRRSRKS